MSSSWFSVSKYLDRSTDTAYVYPCSAFQRIGLVSKGGIGQAVAERIQGFFTYGVKVAVAYIDALFVSGIVVFAESTNGAVVLPCRPGGGQLARGILFAQ